MDGFERSSVIRPSSSFFLGAANACYPWSLFSRRYFPTHSLEKFLLVWDLFPFVVRLPLLGGCIYVSSWAGVSGGVVLK